MPYTIKTEGLTQVEKLLNTLGENAQAVASVGLYEGAGEMSEAIKSHANGIQTVPFHYAVFIQRDASPEEKAIVTNARVGIAKFDKSGGGVNTSVGYSKAGYATLAGRRKPIPKIANAINSGTSFMRKQPFFRQAVNNAKERVSDTIVQKIEEKIEEMKKQSGG